MEREQELQQNIAYLREKLPAAEPELPLSLQGSILKQKALAQSRTSTISPWKKLAPMACAFVMIAAVGIYGAWNRPSVADTAENLAVPQIAAYSAEEAKADPAAYSLARVVEYSVEIETHLTGADSKKVLRERYPGVKFYTITWVGDFWTVIHVRGIGGDMAIAVRADETEVLEEENCYVVRELESGKELRFDALTLELLP